MTAIRSARPLTAGSVLLGATRDADTTEVLARAFQEHGVARSGIRGLRHLTGPALHTVARELADVTEQTLDIDLGALLIAGWREYPDLTGAAERTRADPVSEEVAVLTTHRVVSTHRPSVELLIDTTTAHVFVFTLTVTFDLSAVLAVVRQGELVAVRGGECVVTVRLTLNDAQFTPTRHQHIDPLVLVEPDLPISLLPDQAMTRPIGAAGPTT